MLLILYVFCILAPFFPFISSLCPFSLIISYFLPLALFVICLFMLIICHRSMLNNTTWHHSLLVSFPPLPLTLFIYLFSNRKFSPSFPSFPFLASASIFPIIKRHSSAYPFHSHSFFLLYSTHNFRH